MNNKIISMSTGEACIMLLKEIIEYSELGIQALEDQDNSRRNK